MAWIKNTKTGGWFESDDPKYMQFPTDQERHEAIQAYKREREMERYNRERERLAEENQRRNEYIRKEQERMAEISSLESQLGGLEENYSIAGVHGTSDDRKVIKEQINKIKKRLEKLKKESPSKEQKQKEIFDNMRIGGGIQRAHNEAFISYKSLSDAIQKVGYTKENSINSIISGMIRNGYLQESKDIRGNTIFVIKKNL